MSAFFASSRSPPGAYAGTIGPRGDTGETRSYPAPSGGRLSASPLLGHSDIARSASAVIDSAMHVVMRMPTRRRS